MQSSLRPAVGRTALQHGVDVGDRLRVERHATKAADTVFPCRVYKTAVPHPAERQACRRTRMAKRWQRLMGDLCCFLAA